MKKLYVNEITNTNTVLVGISAQDSMVLNNFKTIHGETLTNKLLKKSNQTKEFYIIERAYQFVYILRKSELGLSMEFIDFKNNIDSALDEYISRNNNNWEKEDLDKIARLATEIIEDKNYEKSELSSSGFDFR